MAFDVLTYIMAKAVGESVLDEYLIPIMINEYGVKEAMKRFIQSKRHLPIAKTVGRFYEAAAKIENRKFTSQFYKYTTSPSPVGTKLDDNEGMVCTPSTISTPGRDDYAKIPLFACFEVNYTIDSTTLEPVIHAIKDVCGDYTATPTDSLVGVMQMTGWVRRYSTETTKTVEYQANPADGFKPLPEAVRASDNTVRPFVIHAKYAAGYNASGLLSSVSGVQPATYRNGSTGSTKISHDDQITQWRKWGLQYGGSALCDIAFLQLMFEIKYAVLGSAQKMSGCRSYAYTNLTVAAAEDGVTRVLLSETDAAKLVVGSCVSVGTGNDRAKDTCYSICDIVPILSIEDVEGVAYKAVNLDTESTFNVPAGAVVLTHPWRTGATDDVSGNDGSPFDYTSDKEPYKLQGIEVQNGIYEVVGDTTLNQTATADGVPGVYNIYTNRLAKNVSSGDGGVNPVLVGTIPKSGDSTEWKYVAELNWNANDQEAYLAAKAYGAGSTTGYCGAQNLDAEGIGGWRAWLAFGALNLHDGGLITANLHAGLSGSFWYVGARACGTGGNRGEFTPYV